MKRATIVLAVAALLAVGIPLARHAWRRATFETVTPEFHPMSTSPAASVYKTELHTAPKSGGYMTNGVPGLAPGIRAIASPDGSRVFFQKSRDPDTAGLCTLFLYEMQGAPPEAILSLWHVDPDSGSYWNYRWAQDSKAILFHGTTGGFSAEKRTGYYEFAMAYLLSDGKWYYTKPESVGTSPDLSTCTWLGMKYETEDRTTSSTRTQ